MSCNILILPKLDNSFVIQITSHSHRLNPKFRTPNHFPKFQHRDWVHKNRPNTILRPKISFGPVIGTRNSQNNLILR